MQNFINIAQFSQTDFLILLNQARQFLTFNTDNTAILENKFIANLFFEPSTRTLCSFEIAAKRLGANVINLNIEHSSTKKGETIVDTLLNLKAMGVQTFVIRHQAENLIDEIATAFDQKTAIINAGIGTQQHPSQALLDMLTIQQYKPDFSNLTVAIIGDIFHSRVAHSDIAALQLLNTKEIRLIAPKSLLPKKISAKNIVTFTEITNGLKNVDVIMTLRMQHERADANKMPSTEAFHQQYGLTMERLHLAKSDAIVMHPGPMNRGIEITDEVVASPQSVILQQPMMGIAARMAILQYAFAM